MQKIKFLLLFFIMLGMNLAHAQFPEGFETAVPPAGWATFIGTNGAGTGFDWTTTTTANTGIQAAFVRYESSGSLNEDWLVTPQFTPGATTSELNFFQRQGFDLTYGTIYTVRVSTASQITDTDFTIVDTQTEADFGTTYSSKSVDLSAYIGTPIYVAFVMENNNGDNWYIDDVDLPDTALPPTCDAILTTPADGDINVDIESDISWSAATGVVDGYVISIGTTPGGTDIANAVDVGNVTTYDPPTALPSSQSIYVTIVPYNAGGGSATSCTEESFTTTCLAPIATFTVIEDCANGFTVDVDITSLGNAVTVDITDGTTTLAAGVGTGITNVGPFTNGTPVDLTIVHDMDAFCNVVETGLINPTLCPTIVTCGTQTTESYCYNSNETTGFLYTSSDGTSPLIMNFTGGSTEGGWDFITFYDGIDNTAPVITGPLDGDHTGLSVSSAGTSIYMELTSDGSNSCASSQQTQLDWTVDCLSCTPGAGTAVVGTCDDVASTFMVDVDITNLGDGTINIANDAGVTATSVTTTGVTSVGPFPFGTVTITLEHPTDATCNVVLSAITLAACPPANDLCADATTMLCGDALTGQTTVAGTDNGDGVGCASGIGVWYTYVGTGDEVTVSLPTASFDSELAIASTDSDCNGVLTNIGCSDVSGNGGESVTFISTIGTTYYFYVAYYFNSTITGTFDISIVCTPAPTCLDGILNQDETGIDCGGANCPACPVPANDECADATTMLCGDALTSQTTASGTDNGDGVGCASGIGVWYTYVGTGDEITVSLPTASFDSELAIASTDSDCNGVLTNIDCSDVGGNGGESITFISTIGTTYYFYVAYYTNSTTIVGTFDISVSCVCPAPEFTLANGGNNCPLDEYFIEVDITNLNGASAVNILNDAGIAATNGVDGTGTPYSVGPFAAGTTVEITVEDANDATCFAQDNFTTPASCPPANDLCDDATVVTCGTTLTGETTVSATGSLGSSCFGSQGDNVWYRFVGTGDELTITVDATGEVAQMDVYESTDGTCATITCNGEGNDGLGANPTIATFVTTASTVYYIAIGHWIDSGAPFTFDIEFTCVDPCATSTLAATATATDMTCLGMDGTATASVTGGDGTYTYLWDDATMQTTATATGLVAGMYNVVVTETSSGCTAMAMATVANGCAANPCVDGYETGNQLTGMLDMNADYETDQGIDSDQVIGSMNNMIGVDYDAAVDIDLLPGFEVILGVEFDAFIDGCQGGTDSGTGGNQ